MSISSVLLSGLDLTVTSSTPDSLTVSTTLATVLTAGAATGVSFCIGVEAAQAASHSLQLGSRALQKRWQQRKNAAEIAAAAAKAQK